MQKQTQLSEMPVATLIITIVVMLGLLTGVLYYFATNVAKFNPSVVIAPIKKEVVIKTDKMEYEQGEDIVWYSQGYKLGDLFLLRESCNDNFTTGPELEEYKNGIWKKINWYNPMEKECFVAFLECARLKNPFNRVIKTKYIYYENKETFLEKGLYRIKMAFGRICEQENQKMGELKNLFAVYSNEFTIKEEQSNIVVETDKAEYEAGEKLKVTIKNNSDDSIWYFSDLYLSNLKLTGYKNEQWTVVPMLPPSPLPPGHIPEYSELKPSESAILEYALESAIDKKFLNYEKYKLSFNYEEIKYSKTQNIIYSNEFTIK